MNQPSSQNVTINRALVGTIAVAMLGGAGVLWPFAGSQNIWIGACLKVGLVMGALWLALPTISRHGSFGQASWATVIGAIALLLVLTGKNANFRIILPMLVVVGGLIAILRPRSKSRPR